MSEEGPPPQRAGIQQLGRKIASGSTRRQFAEATARLLSRKTRRHCHLRAASGVRTHRTTSPLASIAGHAQTIVAW